MRRKIRIGGRGSSLARAQTRLIINAIAAAHPELELEPVVLRVSGDANLKPFADISDPAGIKGLFTFELEQALLDGTIDLAVHSLKDVPMQLDARLPLVAYFRRDDPRDTLVLPANGAACPNAPIGCSSLRRRAQLNSLFPGRAIGPLRGNVETRLRKLDEGQFSMLVLAAAGLRRLGLAERIARLFSIDEMVPAPGQGILVCQGRAGEDYSYLDAVRDRDSEDCAIAERRFAACLGGGCAQPVGAFAVIKGEEMTLTGFFQRNGRSIRASLSGPRGEGEKLGEQLTEQFMR